ncbi:MAG: pyruvate oxidoreductase [Vulcanisaeta sp. OSP_8]|jgi:Pyruvate:ferredoxin oxidoreductase and related 2-oxoacid:ferredoxin oxidoreductases, gamma subunit|nr:MAG: pyruvate oxidoreductase [Vulcanisaeta sp. OSP_8]
MRLEMRFAGFGGQGVITAGRLLALIIIESDPSMYVIYSPSYGFQTRGGDAISDVIISDEEIDYPKARALNLALILSQQAYNKYCKYVKDDGTLIIDKYVNKQNNYQGKRHYELDILANARKLGGDVYSSMIALGSAIALLSTNSLLRDKLTIDIAKHVVINYFRESLIGKKINIEDVINKNITALRLGYDFTVNMNK